MDFGILTAGLRRGWTLAAVGAVVAIAVGAPGAAQAAAFLMTVNGIVADGSGAAVTVTSLFDVTIPATGPDTVAPNNVFIITSGADALHNPIQWIEYVVPSFHISAHYAPSHDSAILASPASFQYVGGGYTSSGVFGGLNLLVRADLPQPIFQTAVDVAADAPGVTSTLLAPNGAPVRFIPTHLSFSPFAVGGVPEPASWALMLAGFAGMGATLRRSRRRAA